MFLKTNFNINFPSNPKSTKPSVSNMCSYQNPLLCRVSYEPAMFYVYGSVHRWSILIIVKRNATQSSLFIILQVHSTCFGCQPHPSSGVHKTVIFFEQLPPSNVAKITWPRWREVAAVAKRPHWREVAAQKIWPVPEAVVTVLCTPDDGCGWHPKHVEWTCKIINRPFCVASRWTIININVAIYFPFIW